MPAPSTATSGSVRENAKRSLQHVELDHHVHLRCYRYRHHLLGTGRTDLSVYGTCKLGRRRAWIGSSGNMGCIPDYVPLVLRTVCILFRTCYRFRSASSPTFRGRLVSYRPGRQIWLSADTIGAWGMYFIFSAIVFGMCAGSCLLHGRRSDADRFRYRFPERINIRQRLMAHSGSYRYFYFRSVLRIRDREGVKENVLPSQAMHSSSFLLPILILGPTAFILNMSTESLGAMLY